MEGGESPFLSTQRLPVHDSHNSQSSVTLLHFFHFCYLTVQLLFCFLLRGNQLFNTIRFKRRLFMLHHIKVSSSHWHVFLNFKFRVHYPCVSWKCGFIFVRNRTSGKRILSYWQVFLSFLGRIFDFIKCFNASSELLNTTVKTTKESSN